MFDRTDAGSLDALLAPMSRRAPAGVFFARVCGWGEDVKRGVWAFHEAARRQGVVMEGQIANPDERQLSYLKDVLGDGFEPDEAFLVSALSKWTPRMSPENRAEFARSLCAQFDELRARGKPQSVLRNVYFKMMCWLYYRLERLMPFLGQDDPPRVLYACAGITAHELMLLRLVNRMGADILLLETAGDAPYLKHDPQSLYSQLLVPAGTPFPENFSLKQLRREMAAPTPPAPAQNRPAPAQNRSAPSRQNPQAARIDPYAYFQKPARSACTNAWMSEADYGQILTPAINRGDDLALFYNAFIRVRGVRDKLTYLSELHQFYQRFLNTGRRIVIVDEGLPTPGQEEIARIRRRNYRTAEEMAVDLAGNIPGSASAELQRLMQRAFVQTLLRAQKQEPTLNRLLTGAVYLLCWVQRYQAALFQGYRDGDMPCFVLMGGCRNAHEALYPYFLSLLPVDVLILAPDLNRSCALSDERLLELKGTESMPTPRFPRDAGSLQVRTLASHAEQDLTEALYADSGLYRSRQFSRAEALTLQTTYDELFILWDQELKYRSGFDTAEQAVTMPVIYAKVSGVEGGKTDVYWQRIKALLGKDAYLARRLPIMAPGAPNPFQSLAVKAVRDGVLRRAAIREHRQYPFGIIREELQEHIFDKLQLMLDRRLIKGTFENGAEYAVVATVLNMDKALVRMLQSFDFTQRNPKLVCVAAGEGGATLEDAILTTFLNLAGFDIALFVPTGYQTVERFLNDNYPVEHQAGEYMYDLTVPDFKTLPPPKGRSWLDNLFKRGN